MKRSLFYLAILAVTLVFAACSESAPATEEGNAAEAPAAAEAQAPAERTINQEDAAERLLNKYQSMGIELTEEQTASIRAITGKYDFSTETDKGARQDMRGRMQKEIMGSVLTPEQVAAFEAARQKR